MSTVDDPESFELDASESTWYDLWHTHVDWDGRGNLNASAREPFLVSLFRIFDRAVQQTSGWTRPSNVWLLFHPEASEDDAVYVHTSNPNGTPFPYPFEGVSWGVQPPALLGAFLRAEHEVGVSNYNGEMYWVRVRDAR